MSMSIAVVLVYLLVPALVAFLLYWVIRLAVRHALRDVGVGGPALTSEIPVETIRPDVAG